MMGLHKEQTFRLIVGTMIIASAVLAYGVSRWWLLFTLFIGLNLFQSGLTKWCLLEKLLEKR